MLFLFVNNTSMFSRRTEGSPVLLLHRGMSQRYTVPDRLDNCAASQMLPSQHDYLENTIRSMGRAFELGADIVEFDIHPTEDRQFAVFHDRLLECRTNGHGFTRAHRMAELQALDIGYGYTADHGKTFPFRGKGVGLMPSMDQVLSAFPDRSFLIDMKATEPEDGALLASHLLKLPQEQRSKLMVFGRDPVLEKLREKMPEISMFSAASTTSCLVQYMAYGWTGMVPRQCRKSPVWIPLNVAPLLWAWPNRFINRFERQGSFVILMGDFPANEISPRLDSAQDLIRIPANFTGGIWTNDVTLFRGQRDSRARVPRH